MIQRTLIVCSLVLATAPAHAQTAPSPAPAARGRLTIHAIRLSEPLKIDGRLDEPLYREPAITPFIQVDPHNGEPGSQKTEGWISFDRDHIYASLRDRKSTRLNSSHMSESRMPSSA